MPQFPVNPNRFDPYKSFKFRVKFDNHYVAGVSRVSPLVRRTAVVEFREGGEPSIPRRSPGVTAYDPIVLERGVTQDHEFEAWANKAFALNAAAESEASIADFRKDVVIDLFNEAGQKVISYKVFRCWVSEYQALPELDANGNAVAIEFIKLENEGWERDPDLPEPAEPKLGPKGPSTASRRASSRRRTSRS